MLFSNIVLIIININLCTDFTYGFKPRESRSVDYKYFGVEGKNISLLFAFHDLIKNVSIAIAIVTWNVSLKVL